MLNVYRHRFYVPCPSNGRKIEYNLEIRSRSMIMVEEIVAACQEAAAIAEPYHEPMADLIHKRLGGEQLISATHHGVAIGTVRGSLAPADNRALVGVSGSFRAWHDDPLGLEGRHEHVWEVTAWFAPPNRVDARCYLAALRTLLERWNGTVLPPEMAWNEDIARVVGTLANCVEVEVRRPDAGIHARVPIA